ncbi:MAG TPA: prephenate dehydrogenase/arogenate dehydrogenase family protein [Gemmatimonadaceae bacterium]|jgi:prephenate dehydrogenase|nr:prephenate dehydrogenase/arogenate dehydrogenase family protein [Gemmatimonadaceae bacterium]
MLFCRNAAVIGLGLIGGSVARDLAANGVTVRAYDADPAQLDAAARDGVVTHRLDSSLCGVEGAELVVIAVPVDAALDVLRCIAPLVGQSKLVTDVGSTKGRIVALAGELGLGDRFVGSHPMAGDHRSGWNASRAGLFVDAPVYLCPVPNAPGSPMRTAQALWRGLGATTIEMDADEHDRWLAWTSHLPHMIAVALGLTLEEGRVTRDDLGPGGRDMTRIAGSSPEMWTAIGVDNAAEIERALAVAERAIAAMRAALRTQDRRALRETFVAARAWFDSRRA